MIFVTILSIKQNKRIDFLVKIIKNELIKVYDTFVVKILQLYYNDNYDEYKKLKTEDITNLVTI